MMEKVKRPVSFSLFPPLSFSDRTMKFYEHHLQSYIYRGQKFLRELGIHNLWKVKRGRDVRSRISFTPLVKPLSWYVSTYYDDSCNMSKSFIYKFVNIYTRDEDRDSQSFYSICLNSTPDRKFFRIQLNSGNWLMYEGWGWCILSVILLTPQ